MISERIKCESMLNITELKAEEMWARNRFAGIARSGIVGHGAVNMPAGVTLNKLLLALDQEDELFLKNDDEPN